MKLLKNSEVALLQHIQQSPELCSMFLVDGPGDSVVFNPRAIDVYEASAQKFLKHMLVIGHIIPGSLLQEPEYLFIL